MVQSQESGGPRPLLCLVKVSIFYRTHYSEMVHGASKPKRLLLVESALSLLKVSSNAFTQIYYDTIIINRHLNIGLVYFSAKLLTMCKKRTLWFKTTRQWSMRVFLTLWTNIPISEINQSAFSLFKVPTNDFKQIQTLKLGYLSTKPSTIFI